METLLEWYGMVMGAHFCWSKVSLLENDTTLFFYFYYFTVEYACRRIDMNGLIEFRIACSLVFKTTVMVDLINTRSISYLQDSVNSI